MKKHALIGIMDWRAFSTGTARPSGISYRLRNGKEGNITDPEALRTFYFRLFHGQKTKTQKEEPRPRRQT